MSYCINPKCQQRHNLDNSGLCLACSTPLLIQEQYLLLEPLRKLDERDNTEVFATVDAAGKPKVLKVLKNPNLLLMFEREVQTLQKLQDLCISSCIPYVGADDYFTFVLDANNGQELHCLVMEKIEGQNLEQYLEQHGQIDQKLALKWLKQLTNILDMLHQKDVFHRDIKLSNIMLKSDGQLVLIDFGTARSSKSDTYFSKLASVGITGIVSPGYSPLEQMNGKAEPKSDFYALGRCFIHLLTGTHPLDLCNNPQTGKLAWHDRAPEVETWLADLIDDLSEPFLGNRPFDTKEILQCLENGNDVVYRLKRTLRRTQSLHQLKRMRRTPSLHWWVVLNIVLFVAILVFGPSWFQDKRRSLEAQSIGKDRIIGGADRAD